jgi:hypothetical protein
VWFLFPFSVLAGTTRYVWTDSPTNGPGTAWINAFHSIQPAVNASFSGDEVLVTNGVYDSDGAALPGVALTNRVCITNAITVRSVNGPVATIIQGAPAWRGVYLGAGASLSGFTVTNGHTLASGNPIAEQSGGGVWCDPSATVSNCVFLSNSANVWGGGAYHGTLVNCVLSGGSALQGGGAYESVLNNCTVSDNEAMGEGGGTYGGTLDNCIVYDNTASIGPNYHTGSLTFCCTVPSPGADSIADPPEFVDPAHGDYRLTSSSPCVDAGTNRAWMTGEKDLAGSPRVLNGCVDMGAYEYYGAPLVNITNEDETVYGEWTPYPVGGTNNAYVVGAMVWTNAATGTGGTFVAATPWLLTNIALAFGANTITVRGWNPGGDEALDSVTITRRTQLGASSPEHFVSTNGASVWPYTNWPTAARVIQDAVNAAMAGDTVWVSNGTYRAGGALDSRVVIPADVTVRSVRGRDVTAIEGELGGGWHGIGSLRCASLEANARLYDFTLTNGHTRTDLGSGAGAACAGASSILSNCTVVACTAYDAGGGVYRGTLYHCAIEQCSSIRGGGAWSATLVDCVVSNNVASTSGGGVNFSTLTRCRVLANHGVQGGGAYDSSLINCVLRGNVASSSGGGAGYGTLRGCAVLGNSAPMGGGVSGGTLYNCTVIGNESGNYGGGVAEAAAYNSVIFDNVAPTFANHYFTPLAYSCTTPLPPDGTANIDTDPLLADAMHLSAGSPCRGAGFAAYSSGQDMDREAWLNPPSMGCDEYSATATGALSVAIHADFTSATPGFPVDFAADIDGHATGHYWDFGDGHSVTSHLFTSHAWGTAGSYPVVLTAANATYPSGVSATVQVSVVSAPTRYVSAGNPFASPPYTNWTSAASSIQDAVRLCDVPGSLVLVTNGLYDSGGLAFADGLTNRVAITNATVVRSVNGPTNTAIKGAGPAGHYTAARCAYLGTKAMLCGFTLTNGFTDTAGSTVGGGALCATGAIVSNCVIRGNQSVSHGGGAYGGVLERCEVTQNTAGGNYGGGVYASILRNCLVWNNAAGHAAGGAYRSELYNCTVATNRASNHAGGIEQCLLWNSIVYGNTPTEYQQGQWSHSCATPVPTGMNNIAGPPLFANPAAGDFRLLPGSPCIDTGTNAADMADAVDLSGYPRVLNGCVDMGAYEYFGLPWVDITNAPVSVFGEETPFTVRGTNNVYVTGTMWWTNTATGASGSLAAGSPWMIPGVALVFGENPVRVYGARPDGLSANDAAIVTRLKEYGGPSPIHYADANGGDVWPYTNWVTAAHAIQDAVDAARASDTVWVTNGLYTTGGKAVYATMTNRVAIDKAIEVRSVNGAAYATIEGAPAGSGGNGDGAVRCVYVGANACLNGFTLTNGHTRASGDTVKERRGGGSWCEASGTVSNCVVTGNSAASQGGGSAYGTLCNCVLIHNRSEDSGGGASLATLLNCTVSDNNATSEGGGAINCTAHNSIVYNNTPDNLLPNNATTSCGFPLPDGAGNIDTAPSFVDRPNGNYRLAVGSAGIDVGTLTQAPGIDLLGVPRPLDGNADGTNQVDMGAYEYISATADSDADQLTDADEVNAGTNPLRPDTDGDGARDGDEMTAGMDPLDRESVFCMLAPSNTWVTGNHAIVLRWWSAESKSYTIERTTNLLDGGFPYVVRSNITAIVPMNTETDTTATVEGPYFYRVRLQ